MKTVVKYFQSFIPGLFVVLLCLLASIPQLMAQRLAVPVKFKIEDGGFEGSTVVIKNNTSGESNSVSGSARMNLELKLNCDYVISFVKAGYITKKIGLNTTIPAERASQGISPFPFELNLFPQFDNINIVVFNQPVAKIAFSRLIDDFDYDTDYTKQIQSAIQAAEEEIVKRQAEEKITAEARKKEEARKKVEDAAQARAEELARKEAERKAAEDARKQAEADAKARKAEEEQQRKDARARQEEEKQNAFMKMEEEERAKAKAYEEEEVRRNATASSGSETAPSQKGATGQDSPPGGGSGIAGRDQVADKAGTGSGTDTPNAKPGKGAGEDFQGEELAGGVSKSDQKSIIKAKGFEEIESKPVSHQDKQTFSPVADKPSEPSYERMPAMTVEELDESNRQVLKVTVRKENNEIVYSKIKYSWGGVYFFRNNTSISESMFRWATGMK